jgi:hypothetical protein
VRLGAHPLDRVGLAALPTAAHAAGDADAGRRFTVTRYGSPLAYARARLLADAGLVTPAASGRGLRLAPSATSSWRGSAGRAAADPLPRSMPDVGPVEGGGRLALHHGQPAAPRWSRGRRRLRPVLSKHPEARLHPPCRAGEPADAGSPGRGRLTYARAAGGGPAAWSGSTTRARSRATGKPYIPGPTDAAFERSLLERAGFEVGRSTATTGCAAMGARPDVTRRRPMDLEHDLFATYLLRRRSR